MYNSARRIAKLEKQFGTVEGEPPLLLVVSRVECRIALDEDRCIEILRECGVLPTGPTVAVVNLRKCPEWPQSEGNGAVSAGECLGDLRFWNRGALNGYRHRCHRRQFGLATPPTLNSRIEATMRARRAFAVSSRPR